MAKEQTGTNSNKHDAMSFSPHARASERYRDERPKRHLDHLIGFFIVSTFIAPCEPLKLAKELDNMGSPRVGGIPGDVFIC